MSFKNVIPSMLFTFLGPFFGPNTADKASSGSPGECAVCLSSLDRGSGTRVLPCRHEFHGACLERWLAVPNVVKTCPLCRFLMEEEYCVTEDYYKCSNVKQECFTEEMVIWFSSFHVAGF